MPNTVPNSTPILPCNPHNNPNELEHINPTLLIKLVLRQASHLPNSIPFQAAKLNSGLRDHDHRNSVLLTTPLTSLVPSLKRKTCERDISPGNQKETAGHLIITNKTLMSLKQQTCCLSICLPSSFFPARICTYPLAQLK